MEIKNLFFKNQSATLKIISVKAKLYRIIRPYLSPYPESIFFLRDERVTVGKEFSDEPNWKGWLWYEGKNTEDSRGWVPMNHLEEINRNIH